MKYLKKAIASLLLFGSLISIGLAENSNFSFVPVSGTQLKMLCNYNFKLKIEELSGMNYNAFEYSIKFDPANVSLVHSSITSPFFFYVQPTIVGSIYNGAGSLPGGVKYSGNIEAITFGFKSLSTITNTLLNITTNTGTALTFGSATTDDGGSISYASSGNSGGMDILTSVFPATYTFAPLPCVPDATNPTITSTIPAGGDRNVPSNQVVSFLTYDWAGAGSVSGPSPLANNNRSHYWYQGLSTLLSNYVAAPATVDNQEGVNSGTIVATVACSTCSTPWSYTLSGASLNIIDWNGDGSHNQWTWNTQRRGYTVSFAAPAAYEVEKLVTVTLQAVDNPNESAQTHTGSTSFSFNAPLSPTISRLLPSANTFVSPSKANAIRLFLSDDWAGIDTSTLKITIPTIMSGAEQVLTGYTYSGSELNFVLSGGSAGLGNSGKYVVDFYPTRDFPANQSITITGTVLDLAGNTGTLSTSFTTRPDCSFFGCSEMLNLTIADGIHAGAYEFTGTILVVTGTNANSPYPYLTGANNDILMCGYAWTGAVLTGNVQIYNGSSTLINGTVYSGNALYITGLNFSIVNGVIIVQ